MKIVISGYGKMGHMVEDVLRERNAKGIGTPLECVGASEDIAAFDPALAAEAVCIDFTTPDAFKSNYKAIAEHFKAAVIGTTGWNDIAGEVKAYFEKCGTPMIYASNFSLGVNVTFALAEMAASKLKAAAYSPSIVETHHIHKLDAPSGTAKTLGAVVQQAMDTEVPIESRRIGEVPGIHELTFTSGVDKITLTHEAFSRKGFAEGAVIAATMTEGLSGVHEFKELILR